MDGSRRRELHFGPFSLDAARTDLRRDGAPVEIQATPLRLLCYLAERPGELVTREELLDRVWGGVHVSDNAIATALKQLRLVLDDRDREPPWIETLRGRGIRFNAPVEGLGTDLAPEPSRTAPAPAPSRRSLARRLARATGALVAAVVALLALAWVTWPAPLGILFDVAGVSGPPVDPPLPSRPSIAVLPFLNLSGDPSQEYFSDGITEDLTTDLAQNPTLFVISRNSAFTYKDRAVDVRQVGRELGVRYVVEGSVRRGGGRLLVTAQLIEAQTGGHLYSGRFDRGQEDVFAVQQEIAERLTMTLRSEIHGVEIGEIWGRGTRSVQAHDATLEGWSHAMSFRRSRVTGDARRLAVRAITLDPGYYNGYMLMASTFSLEYMLGWSNDPTLLDRSEALGRTAMELAPQARLGGEGLASIALRRGQLEEALAFADSGVAARPNFSIAHLSRAEVLTALGRPLAALEEMRTALRLDPLGLTVTPEIYAAMNLAAGRRQRAVEFLEQGRRSNPDLVIPRVRLAAWYEEEGDHAKARELVGEILRIVPDFDAEWGARYVPPQLSERARERLVDAGLPELHNKS